jgi:pimeloyl-ACP methyl ester carboxylesterase
LASLDDIYREFGEASEAAQLLKTELGNLLLFHIREHNQVQSSRGFATDRQFVRTAVIPSHGRRAEDALHTCTRREFLKSAVLGSGSMLVAGCLQVGAASRSSTVSGGGNMQTVTSKDGTRIAYWRSGAGPPLLLVHGMVADHSTTWRFVLPELEQHFTVYAMDRRGRGGSGDSPAYELQREAEDLAAVVDSIGQPVNLLGHSHGGLCALEATLLTANLRRVIIYEGVALRGAEVFSPGAADRLEAMLELGDAEGMLVVFLRDEVKIPPEEIDLLRSQRDAWAVRLQNAATVPREIRATARYNFEPERFRRLQAPTLLLVGEASPPVELENARAVAEALPNGRVVVLPGQQHLAMYTAPEMFVREVVGILEE